MTIAPTIYNSRFLKADRRALIQANGSSAYRTNFEQQARLDDVFLLPGASSHVAPAGLASQLLVLPAVGGALLTVGKESERALLPGCLYALPASDGAAFTLTNPFEKETVNVLVMQALVPGAATTAVQEMLLPLTAKNVLVAPEGPTLPVWVGIYDSRVKGTIPALNPTAFSLCYVLNGSFEIEDRLVEHRDALLLWETPTIKFEALSETAILLYLEFT